MSSSPPSPKIDSLAIVGVGLIGGSIAAAVKRRQLASRVIGVGRSRPRLEAARNAGLLDAVSTDVDEIGGAEFVVVCTPVDRIVDDVRRMAALGTGTIITDAGSVKACLCDELRSTLPDGVTFVGSHPMAGSERSGWEHAEDDLFVDRVCVLTPDDNSPEDAVDFVERFWQSIGMRTLRMSADEHDAAVAATSHVPHVAAAAVASLLNESIAPLASTGFRDTTRIAAGGPELWASILQGNREAVLNELDRLSEHLEAYRRAIEADDADAILRLLTDGRDRRRLL